jgi:SAM-dependent methyltransferase
MSAGQTTSGAAFDAIASSYDTELARGLSVSGEGKEFFAEGRVKWVGRRLAGLNFTPRRILDFGCGTGSSAPYLLALPGAEHLVGTDVSEASLEVARRTHGSGRAAFVSLDGHQSPGDFDLAFCNGVFHHIPPDQRAAAVDHVFASLRPGGLFAFWENNPLNPGTRIVMRRCSFDRDAITLRSGQSRALLRAAGFDILRTDFLFIFPRPLRFLRALEPHVCSLPLGAQYMVLCRKPAA